MMRGMSGMFFRYNSCASRCTAMASTNGYATMTSSLLSAAGSPLNAASVSVCSNSRMRGRLSRKSSVSVCASRAQVFLRIFRRRIVFEALVNFIFERAEHGVQQRRGFDLDFGRVNQFLVEEPGKQQPQQVDRDDRDRAFRRKIFAVEMIDAADARVRGDETIGQLGDGRLHVRSIPQGRRKRKRGRGIYDLRLMIYDCERSPRHDASSPIINRKS